MTLDGFTPGTYTYTCDFASGGDASFSLTESTDPQTFDNGKTSTTPSPATRCGSPSAR